MKFLDIEGLTLQVNKIKEKVISKPSSDGQRGQVLTSDGEGGTVWAAPADNITANGGSLTLHDSTGDVTITATQLRQLLATLS